MKNINLWNTATGNWELIDHVTPTDPIDPAKYLNLTESDATTLLEEIKAWQLANNDTRLFRTVNA